MKLTSAQFTFAEDYDNRVNVYVTISSEDKSIQISGNGSSQTKFTGDQLAMIVQVEKEMLKGK